ncbi:3'(2'),5'-bisphosphate nucleotidase CysQ [Silanimonas lenta]|uniref:3'(2'),5'-bisphosphate nucleotidase CysQ n=1 Tax=Silanimonas lenta TaxID=265429 RepID=UPI000683E758|nr:3'(2'),5'-bisphosphate nucleotidase CysQ [Silanimonas lenta]GIX38645.1 MAG: 3'(2'),5'-bisphosphate nucleotidase CysQ [Silanimonas sp.]
MSAAEVPAATGAGTLDRAALRAPLVALARRAGEAILAVYARDFGVEAKADRSPLTEADLASHRVLVAGLGALAPGIPVLSEESPASEVAERRRWRRLWLVDPLDGTREFVKKNGEFCVCIALVEDGVPVLGVVHAPVGDTGWSALAGGGVWKHGPEGREQRLAPRPASVTPPTLAGLRVAASRSHLDARTAALLERLPGAERVALGSALKFGLLAEGRLDLYPRFGPTSEWDTAAGQCLVEAMGGAVLDLEGRPLRYNQRDTLINGDFLALSDPRLPWESLLD